MNIVVRPKNNYPAAVIEFNKKKYEGVVGKNGVINSNYKREGDLCTPLGKFKIRAVYYRPDRIGKIKTFLTSFEIGPDDVWIVDVKHPMYNKPTKLSKINSNVSYEKLYRSDHIYDVFLDLDYNRSPAIPGRGSAIFLHLSRSEICPQKIPTAGCIALRKSDMLEILRNVDNKTAVEIRDS